MLERVVATTKTRLGRIAATKALSFVVLLPGLTLLTLGTAFADTQNLDDYNEAWIIVAVQSFVVGVIVFGVAGIPVRFLRGRVRVVGVVALYSLTELCRTLTAETQALSRGLVTHVDWFPQVMTATLTGATIYGVASLAINESFDFRTTVADLMTRTALLQTTLARTEIDANIARREIVKSAKETIRKALRSSFKSAESSMPSASKIRALLDVPDDVVRPLSRELR